MVKSGEGDTATGASIQSPAPWLTFRDKTMSDLQGELPLGLGTLSAKQQVAALVYYHTWLLKAEENAPPIRVSNRGL